MDQSNPRMLMKTSALPQFSYCPLVWIFHSRNIAVNKIHERALKLVYDDGFYLGFDELLNKTN